MKNLKVGILGTGDVGRTLGMGLIKLGHKVMLGSRDPKSAKVLEWLNKAGGNASSGSFQEAASFGELIIMAVKGSVVETVIRLAKPENFSGKIILDVTNPLASTEGQLPAVFKGCRDSLAETIQSILSKAKVVKGLNIVGHIHMINPSFKEGKPDMFICGNDSQAKQLIGELLQKWGWNPIDLGDIREARVIEPLCLLWIHYAVKTNSYNHVITLLKK